ncbi:C45 family autoproteolytic acyltransferase/hydolase [Allopusillimonas soli]|nr:C45 family peptidase [Allopusillimonas soli]
MLSLLQPSGTPFEMGKQLGVFGATAVHRHLIESSAWKRIVKWRGSETAHRMRTLVQRQFPAINEEIEGLAQGLQLDTEDVFLWNCRGDLLALAPDGCTTVQIPSANGPRIAHNEDGDPGFRGHCGLGLFAPVNGPRFASFVYPGSLPGHTFAVNAHGLAMTVNNLRAQQIAAGMPRMVLTRALLDLDSLDAALALLRETPRSGGFHLTLAQRGRMDLLSIEFDARAVSVRLLQQPALHANHAIHADMRERPQIITDSSRHRQQRGDTMLQSRDINPLAILADQSDPLLPIYRDADNDPDDENTLATADMHVGEDHVRWQVYGRPGTAPLYSLIDAQPA